MSRSISRRPAAHWLDQAEIWPGIITRQAIRRGTSGPVRLLLHAISNHIASWDEDSAPFEWNAAADQIITRVAIPDRDFKKLAAPGLK